MHGVEVSPHPKATGSVTGETRGLQDAPSSLASSLARCVWGGVGADLWGAGSGGGLAKLSPPQAGVWGRVGSLGRTQGLLRGVGWGSMLCTQPDPASPWYL